ncbi:hypothetical protein GQX74_013784 [Glossina fuscipes]|nr:hypothetical protein GQX74_013784 [Glossina fuscipes]
MLSAALGKEFEEFVEFFKPSAILPIEFLRASAKELEFFFKSSVSATAGISVKEFAFFTKSTPLITSAELASVFFKVFTNEITFPPKSTTAGARVVLDVEFCTGCFEGTYGHELEFLLKLSPLIASAAPVPASSRTSAKDFEFLVFTISFALNLSIYFVSLKCYNYNNNNNNNNNNNTQLKVLLKSKSFVINTC